MELLKRFWWVIPLMAAIVTWAARRIILLKQRNKLLTDVIQVEQQYTMDLETIRDDSEVVEAKEVLSRTQEKHVKERRAINEKLTGDSDRVARYWNRVFGKKSGNVPGS